MIVKVTQKDIGDGIQGNSRKCPMALAIRRAVKTKKVIVGFDKIKIGKETYRIPNRVARFIRRFDAFNVVRPFSINLGPYREK